MSWVFKVRGEYRFLGFELEESYGSEKDVRFFRNINISIFSFVDIFCLDCLEEFFSFLEIIFREWGENGKMFFWIFK